jgi:hypothetical protein
MNRKQIVCLWIGIGIIVLTGIFPPFYYQRPVVIKAQNQSPKYRLIDLGSVEHPKSPEEINNADAAYKSDPIVQQQSYYRIFGYHCIFSSYTGSQAYILKSKIYTSLLLIQWTITSIVTGGLFLTFKKINM